MDVTGPITGWEIAAFALYTTLALMAMGLVARRLNH